MGVGWGPEMPDEASEGLASGPVPVPALPSCVGGSGLFTYLLRASACWPVSNNQLVSSAVEDAVKERIPPPPPPRNFVSQFSGHREVQDHISTRGNRKGSHRPSPSPHPALFLANRGTIDG